MNKKFLPFLFLALIFTIGYFACKKADTKIPPLGPSNEYFPLQKGKYVIYNVDSTIWDDTFCVTITRHRQMMWRVADTFTDKMGRLSYRIETSIRQRPEDVWTPHYVIYATNTGTTLELVHDQLRFINLQFPIVENETWKGNANLNTDDPALSYFKDWDYRYIHVGGAYNNGNVVYDNTVTVLQRDETLSDPESIPKQPSSRTLSQEVFAANIGMVYREYIHWIYDPTIIQNNDPNNDRKCRKGNGVVMRAIDHN
jgi:hypothetical protein